MMAWEYFTVCSLGKVPSLFENTFNSRNYSGLLAACGGSLSLQDTCELP